MSVLTNSLKTKRRVAALRAATRLLAFCLTANPDQTKPKFFVKAPLRGAFTKNLVVGLFSICCSTFGDSYNSAES